MTSVVPDLCQAARALAENHYFRPTPRNGIGYLSAFALIRPEEDDRSLLLPDGWSWSAATVWDW